MLAFDRLYSPSSLGFSALAQVDHASHSRCDRSSRNGKLHSRYGDFPFLDTRKLYSSVRHSRCTMLERSSTWVVRLLDHTTVLLHLCTRPKHERKSEVGLLIKWPFEQADKEGKRCFVDGSFVGHGLYMRYGFEGVGEMKIDLDKMTKRRILVCRGALEISHFRYACILRNWDEEKVESLTPMLLPPSRMPNTQSPHQNREIP